MVKSDHSVQYQLVFQGPRDESSETLRKLRAAFITDLSLDIEKAKFFLEHAPITIEESDKEEALTPRLKMLTEAGAEALIVRSQKIKERKKAVLPQPPSPSLPEPVLKEVIPEAESIGVEEESEEKPESLQKKTAELRLVHKAKKSNDEELPLNLDFDLLMEEKPKPSQSKIKKRRKLSEIGPPKEEQPEDEFPDHDLDPLFRELQKNALLNEEQIPVSIPLKEIQETQQSQNSFTDSIDIKKQWGRYREWVTDTDTRFRIIINEQMVVGTLISCVITILVCALLIPLELHTRSLQSNHNRKLNGFVNTYADFVLYGPNFLNSEEK